jgi:hypothetical protein
MPPHDLTDDCQCQTVPHQKELDVRDEPEKVILTMTNLAQSSSSPAEINLSKCNLPFLNPLESLNSVDHDYVMTQSDVQVGGVERAAIIVHSQT